MGTWMSSTKVLRELVPTGVQLSHTLSVCCPPQHTDAPPSSLPPEVASTGTGTNSAGDREQQFARGRRWGL